MSECILNLDALEIESRTQTVFFATNEFILYKDKNSIVLSSCDGTELSKLKCPTGYRAFECCDFGDILVFMFAGKHISVVDPFGIPIQYELEIEKFGHSITKPFCNGDDMIVFGAQSKDQVHFIGYDFMRRTRKFQTQSWKMAKISDMLVDANHIYGLFDNAYIVCCDVKTGETLWSRFETGIIKPKLLRYEDDILYASRGVLKRASKKGIDSIKIPLMRVWTLEALIGEKLYLTASMGNDLCCYDLRKQKTVWRVRGQMPILQTLCLKGITNGKIHDAMILRMKGFLSVIDLTVGRSVHLIHSDRIENVRKTRDHVLIHKHQGRTDMIASARNEND